MSAIESVEQSDAARQEWMRRGAELGRQDATFQKGMAARQFQIGDWLVEGTEKWQHVYKDAAELFPHYTVATLRNFAHVARAVKISSRDDILSWAHHVAVAHMPSEFQELYLHRAKEEKLSARELARRIDPWADPILEPNSEPEPEKQWPEYPQSVRNRHKGAEGERIIRIHFANGHDVAEFGKLIGQTIMPTTKDLSFPKPYRQIKVHFRNQQDMEEFSKLVGTQPARRN